MFLDDIIDSTKILVPKRRSKVSLRKLEQRALEQRPPRNFRRAFKGSGIKMIAEVKRASPSKGPLATDLDPYETARIYAESGVSAISVLTEPKYFKGSMADLATVRTAVTVPLLCKDFIVNRYQVYEARAAGADAVLLIAAALLAKHIMRDLLDEVHSLGMQALIEVHDEKEMNWVLELAPDMIGINNRDLATFKVSLETTMKLRSLVPKGVMVVSESGISTREDVKRLEGIGVNAILVGEALVKSKNPAAKIGQLMGT